MESSADASSLFDADDNAFYEQLTRQILMLTDEDDDNMGTYQTTAIRKPVVHGYGGSKLEPMKYYSWSETERSLVPSWMESLWAKGGGGGGGGTGVFIPTARSSGKKSGRRRYTDKAKRNNDRGRMYSAVGQKIHG